MKLLGARIGHLREQNQCLSSHRFYCEICGVCLHHSQVSPIDLKHEKYFQKQKQLDPIVPEQATHPISVQCPERWDQILLNCEKQQFCFLHIQLIGTNVWLPEMHNVPPEVDFESSRSPAKSESWKQSQSALFRQYYPHDNIVCIHTYDEFLKSIDSSVSHRPWSILWWIVRAYLLTIEYRVVQFVPSISILEQFERHTFDNSPTDFISSSLKWWSSMHGVDTL